MDYCLKCKKIQKVKIKKLQGQQKNNVFVNCAVCDGKNSKFIKQQQANGLLSSLGIKTLLCKFRLVGPVFW